MLIEFLKFFYEFFVPHFVTEDVVIEYNDDGSFEIICALSDLREYETAEYIATAKSLAFLGHGYFAFVGNFRKAQ